MPFGRNNMLIISILFLILCPPNEGINLTYIIKKDRDKLQPSCIAEEFERYEAIGWVYPIPTNEAGIPKITTKFIPTINSEYNCNFSKNDICSKRWTLRDWMVDDSSMKTKEFISDYRWEDIPTVLISNSSKEFKERIEVDKVFKSGISVRANGTVELLVCSGWNPYNHPCYHFNIDNGEIYLNKYPVLPQNISNVKSTFVEQYKAFSNILTHDEWRNFIISFDETMTIKLFDVNLNRTVIKHAGDENFTAMYLMVRSNNASLWKFHENEFLYTNTTQVSRLGPQLMLFSKDLCISLLISKCEFCDMVFFYQDSTGRKVLKDIGVIESSKWMEIKLKEENIQMDKINIFVETKFRDPSALNQTGYWAIDNVRVCNENEVKVSYLRLNDLTMEEEDFISCQLIKKPNWRPKKHEYQNVKDFPEVTAVSNSTSIKLSWAQENTRNEINYFVQYQANDICTLEPHNLKRLRSSGFLTTKYNEVVIENLMPFTLYNFTISSVLHEADKSIYFNTLETVEPTFEELPHKIQLRATDSAVYVSWQNVPCTSVYGRLIYTLIVNNTRLNFTKKLSLETNTSHKVDGLQPYTHYSLLITTSRNAGNIYKGVHSHTIVLNFTTLAGVAPPVENLELYSMDQNSASLRYDLPRKSNGIPTEMQVKRCNALSFSKCKSYISKIRHCPLWPNKLCVYVDNLMPFNLYSFKISVRNLNTEDFGKEASASGYTLDRVPGVPTNVTYKTVDCHTSTDYCHLNITWLHPYYENGTITSFNLILNSSNVKEDGEDDKYIHEVYKVENKTYMPKYSYQIKYVPYSTHYKLYIQSANTMYKSSFTQLTVKTDNIGDHINQTVKLLEKQSDRILFKIPHLDHRLDFYVLTIVVQDFETKMEIKPDIMENHIIAENICHKFGNTWVSQVLKVENNNTETVTIGGSKNGNIKPNTKYCITFIITNRYKGSEHNVVYYEKLETPEAPLQKNQRLTVVIIIYMYLKKRKIISTPEENNENEYESLPFDDCTNNCVSNDNYDHLVHK
ncbi:hypothetical protein NQ315_006653 [Exocentrus adspersus]|uniref:Fibronectin type-III domain-containing protein n=1 Tax=Exocentrus adspersus TaxID=1586481 RepID=A0AAV8WC23_9CUCU|nr:hypothetical protein NQ315_006653 [Exocentrus adspersus]